MSPTSSMSLMKNPARAFLRSALAACLGIALGLMLSWIAGENPLNVLQILIKSAIGSRYDLGMTLFYSTPLIFTGLSVAIAFRAGLFNVGSEGQLYMGALGGTIFGILVTGSSMPTWTGPWIAILICFLFGAFWGGIVGWMRAYRQSHEVIATIMMNFVAVGICSYVVLNFFKNPENQSPESAVVAPFTMVTHLALFGDAPVSTAMFLAIGSAVFLWFLFEFTVFGYELKAVGENESAALVAGIRVKRLRFWAFVLAGGLAGLVGVAEVFGNVGKFRLGFSPGFGFVGIAVALLARGHPLGILASALLFGALHKGASDLDFETESITRDLALVLQALVIFCVTAEAYLGEKIASLFRRRLPPAKDGG